MLGKLTKHELIASGRMLVPMYIALICASCIGKFFIWVSSKEVFLESVSLSFAKIVSGISSLFTILYTLLIFVVLIATILFILIRFYKNFYTDEGYLMLTLPVNTKSLILSKLFSAIIWSLVSFAVVFGTFALIMNSESTAESFKMMCHEFMLMLERMAPEMHVPVWAIIAEIVVILLLSLIGNYLMFYTAISAGPSFSSKNRVLGSFGAYFVIYISVQFVAFIMVYILSSVLPNYIDAINNSAGLAVQYTIASVCLLNVVLCTVFFFITDHLMKTKTNLE
ncbi:MAG: hypothetical protein RR911_03735 [Oscillospiraceae bacterium]